MRVEWTRLSGDETESVLAVMVCRRHPSAVRVRPSRGDGGIDLIMQDADGLAVLQIKRFSMNLTNQQKNQIASSIRALRGYAARTRRPIVSWDLIMPLNPTRENLIWLEGEASGDMGRVQWKGLDYCDGLAAEFPDVIDYYLRDGRVRLNEMVETLAAVIRGERALSTLADASTPILSPPEVASTLSVIHRALNAADPHYEYDFAVTGTPETPQTTTDTVFAVQSVIDATAWVTFRVKARYIESTSDRPIPLSVKVQVSAAEDVQAVREFLKFGTAFQSPEGAAHIQADLPGGLGGAFEGTFRLVPHPPRNENRLFRLQVLEESGAIAHETRLRLVSSTAGPSGQGRHLHLEQVHGVFSLKYWLDLEENTSRVEIVGLDMSGIRPAEMAAALEVLDSATPPRRMRLIPQYGLATTRPEPLPEGFAIDIRPLLQYARDLATIQDHTTEQMTMLSLGQPGQVADAVHRVVAILRGETVRLRLGKLEIAVDPEDEIEEGPGEFLAYLPLQVVVNGTPVELGHQRLYSRAAHISTAGIAAFDRPEYRTVIVKPVTGSEFEIELSRQPDDARPHDA